MSQINISEQLFEELCLQNQIQVNRIKESSVPGEKRPDYEIVTPFGKILVEVKQCDLNKKEHELQEQLNNRGWTEVYSREPGAKLRSKIIDANKQLKSYGAGSVPSMIVVYDDMSMFRRGTHPYEIKTAMYGIEQMNYTLIGNQCVDVDTSSFKAKMTQNSCTSTSAIAALYKDINEELSIYVFHNIYATMPLNIKSFHGKNIKHFTITEKISAQLQEWQTIE